MLSTHDVDLAWAWADEVLLVADHVVHQGSLVDALTDEPLLAAARLHLPWPVALLRRLGIALDPLDPPRTVEQVAARLAGSASPVAAPDPGARPIRA